jgi:hypothetical protein
MMVPQSSSEFQTDSTTKTREVFQWFTNKGTYREIFKKADIEYPFEHGAVINYTLDCVSINSVTTKIQAPFLTKLPERKKTAQGYHHEANDD